jgi:transposase-like protein
VNQQAAKIRTAVMGILQRGGKVRTKVVANRKKKLLQELVKAHVEPGAEVFTDTLKSYEGLDVEYVHQFVDHAVEYVDGQVHTNGMENFWSLLKRDAEETLRLGQAVPSVTIPR